MSFVKDTFDAITGRGAEKASQQAAQTSAQAQQNALNYLREREELPQQFRESAISMIGGFSGLEGGDPNALQTLQQSPLYQATVGQLPQQEEAILRNQSATGALRGGGTDLMLAQNQQQNRLQAYQNALSPLQGLAGLQSYAPQIAQGMAGIGNTLAQGQVAGAQARQQGIGQTIGLGLNALSLAGFSDARLKDNVKVSGERYGHTWYTWDWNDKAQELGLSGSDEGVMAHEVARTHPELVGSREGYLVVNYKALESQNG